MAFSPAQISSQILASTTKGKTFLLLFERIGLLLGMTLPVVITLYAAVSLTRGAVSWKYPVAALLLASLANLGTTAGYHRMLTHQAFQAHPFVQYFLLTLGAVAGMGSPSVWAKNHLHHHSHSDTEDDIHSPHTSQYRGRRFEKLRQGMDAHMTWLFREQASVVSARVRQVTDTPAVRFVDRTSTLWLFAGLLLPLCFGWSALIWLGFVRLFLGHHITWSVNSICHLWGRQPFPNTKDKSRNNAIVGVLALGEGWHNNHHFRPQSAKHGLLPGQLDLTYAFICLLERCGLASKVRRYAQCAQCQDWYAMGTEPSRSCAKCRRAA